MSSLPLSAAAARLKGDGQGIHAKQVRLIGSLLPVAMTGLHIRSGKM